MGNNEDDPDEGPRDLSEIALGLLDRDNDGRVSLEDFLQSVQDDNLLLEVLGSCLPSGARALEIQKICSSLVKIDFNQYLFHQTLGARAAAVLAALSGGSSLTNAISPFSTNPL